MKGVAGVKAAVSGLRREAAISRKAETAFRATGAIANGVDTVRLGNEVVHNPPEVSMRVTRWLPLGGAEMWATTS
jgi:hypothetical protein